MAEPVSDLTAEFGRRVRDARATAGYTQERFAHACGLDRSYMGHLERGTKSPTLTMIIRITDALGIEPGDLLNGMHLAPTRE